MCIFLGIWCNDVKLCNRHENADIDFFCELKHFLKLPISQNFKSEHKIVGFGNNANNNRNFHVLINFVCNSHGLLHIRSL